MKLTVLALVAALGCASRTSAQIVRAGDNRHVVKVGVFMLMPDGSPGTSAFDNGDVEGDSFSGGVVVEGCRVGAGDYWSGSNFPDWARDAWEFKGRVVSLSDTQAVIYVKWRRARTAGEVSSGPSQTTTLTIGADQSQTLDVPSPPAGPECADRQVIFGAFYVPAIPPTARVVNGAPVSGVGAQAASAQQFSAELWLVRHVPGQPDDVKATTVRLTQTADFDFGIQLFLTSGGGLSVQVNGQLRLVGLVSGQKMLMLDARRLAAFTPRSDPPRDRVPLRLQPEGRASVWRVLPGPDEVIEFEMPPLALSQAQKLPDAFAIRLRIRPVK